MTEATTGKRDSGWAGAPGSQGGRAGQRRRKTSGGGAAAALRFLRAKVGGCVWPPTGKGTVQGQQNQPWRWAPAQGVSEKCELRSAAHLTAQTLLSPVRGAAKTAQKEPAASGAGAFQAGTTLLPALPLSRPPLERQGPGCPRSPPSLQPPAADAAPSKLSPSPRRLSSPLKLLWLPLRGKEMGKAARVRGENARTAHSRPSTSICRNPTPSRQRLPADGCGPTFLPHHLGVQDVPGVCGSQTKP